MKYPTMPNPPLSINPPRLNRNLAALGRIGEVEGGGMMRVAFSDADVAGREFVGGLMRAAGLTVRTDAAGNIIGRKEGSEPGLPAIALGSHTDTVPNGGKYDGALGVVAAVEGAQTLVERGQQLRHPLEVIIFTNEEGTGFHRWLLGSRAMAGLLEPADYTAVDDAGVSLGERLAAVGGDLSRIDTARRHSGEVAAYFELHIEQGPNLERSGVPIGVVSGITGRAVFAVSVVGKANHAGTTPMGERQDALAAAAQLTLAVQGVAAREEICRVATVGRLEVSPNAVNVVPGAVSMGVEFRDLYPNGLTAAETVLRRRAMEIAAAAGVEITVELLESTPPVLLPAGMQELVGRAAEQGGLAHITLPSGAGHDAQAMAAIAPAGMVFVPSVDGVSHAPEEYTCPEDCGNGGQTLLNLLLLADGRLGG